MKYATLSEVIQKKSGKVLFAVLLIGICLISNGMDVRAEYKKVEESELPLSTMNVYRDMDTSFLKTFSFGSTYEDDAFVELETAQQMIDAEDIRLKAGRVVHTSGFYEIGDGGGATYMLSDTEGTGGIELANGLYANIILDTKVIDGKKWGVISPKQLGAKGDGQQAEQDEINNAIGLAADLAENDDSVFRSIVYLPAGEYKCTNQVQINVSNVNFVGEGNKSVIFTDNDYRKGIGYYEFFFTVWGATDLYMADFLVEAREVNGYNYMRQMVFVDCTNVYTYRVNLNIPQESFSKDYYVDKQYSSLTYYSGNKDMTLDSCKLELMCSTYRGANIGVLDFYSRGEENITIMNCELHSDARDEQVGIFSSRLDKDASFIRNVYFVNNTMYSYQPLDKAAAGGWRNMCFTVAYNDSRNISDIYIKGNHFIADLDSKLMTFGDGIESCVVENNMMDIRCTANLGAYLFDSGVSTADRVLIQNNEIFLTYRDTEGTGKASILGGKATVKGNKIVSDTYLGNMGYLSGIYEDNTYINLGCLGTVARNLQEVRNNTIISYGTLDEIMNFTGDGTDQVVDYTGNYIVDYKRVYETNNVWNHVAYVLGTFKEFNFTGNTYLAPNKYYWTYKSVEEPRVADYVRGVFFRGASIGKALCENNVLQGANIYSTYDCTVKENSTEEQQDGVVNLFLSNNETKEYTLNPDDSICTSIEITKDGALQTEIFTDESSVSLETIVKAGHLDDAGECTDEAVTTDKEIVWYSSLEGIASVDNGVVTRNNYGQANVYAVSTDGVQKEDGYALYGKCTIHFVKGFATGIEFEKDNITLQTTKKYKAVYEVTPADKASQSVKWTSSNTDVATVSSIGVIEAIGVGEADITCETLDGTNISKKIHVTVEPLTVKKITLNQSDWYDYEYEQNNNWANKGVEVGDTIQLSVASYTPSDATNTGIKKWVSTNEKVATVDENGFVTAVGAGYCEIRAYSMDEKCYGGCDVWVQPDKIETEDISYSFTDSYIKLEWEPQENIHGYIIYCDKGDGNGYQNVKEITDLNATKYEAYSKKVGWYVEPGKTYKYKIATYLKRVDSNYYSHVYETSSDEISITTYSNTVITKFNTNGVESIGVTVGGTADLGVYCSKNTLASSFKSDNEEIFTVIDQTPTDDNYNLKITGVKEGIANLILKGEDELGYEKKIPVYVYDFQKTGSNIQAEPLIKSVKVTWKVDDKEKQDGFKLVSYVNRVKKETLLSMEQLSLTTDENGDTYATYILDGMPSDTECQVWVAPYKALEDVIFAGPDSNKVTAYTPPYVNVNSITAEKLYLLKVGESEKITAVVGPEDASEPNLIWIPYNSSIIQATETGKVDENTRYAVIKGLKPGISQLNIVANDEENYQVGVKVAVVPEKVTNIEGTADNDSASLSWNLVDGATGYAVYRYDENQWINIANVTENYYEDSGLSKNTLYKYKISAYVSDADGIYESDYTDVFELRTQDKLSVSLQKDTEVTLKNNILTYGETLSKLEFNNAVFVDSDGKKVEGTLAWKNAAATPNAGTTSATWVFTPSDDSYESLNGNIAIIVNKATPYIVTKPSAAAITYGDTLGDSVLTDGAAQYSSEDSKVVAGSFAWKDVSVKPAVADSNSTLYKVVFTPEDRTNYSSLECDITLEVKQAETAPNTPDSIMTVSYQCEKIGAVTLPDGWEWQDSDKDKSLEVNVPMTATAVYNGQDAGNYKNEEIKVTITRKACDELEHSYGEWITVTEATCMQTGEKKRTCSVCKYEDTAEIPATKDITNCTVNGIESSYTYSEKEIKPEITLMDGSITVPKEAYTVSYADNINVGTATVTISGTGEYKGTITKTFVIKNTAQEPTTENPTEEAAEEKQILEQKNDKDIKGSTFGKLCLRMSKVTKNSIKLKWNKVKGADGYIVYGNRCNSNGKIYMMQQLSDTKSLSYTHKKLKKGTYYKYIVRAYKIVDGVKKTVATSKTLHITTSGGKYANYTSVKVPKTKVTIKKGKKYIIKAKTVLPKGKKSKKHKKLAYESSNTKIATVTAKGVIKAKKKGTCYIYVYAQNGVYKKITVKVK